MTLETSLIDSALRNWRSNVDRAGKLFGNLSQEQLLQEVAPGKNRVIYLWGHLTAFNDALIPLLGFGARIHPELDLMFVSNPDRTVPTILLGEDLKIICRPSLPRLASSMVWKKAKMTSFRILYPSPSLRPGGLVQLRRSNNSSKHSCRSVRRRPHNGRANVVGRGNGYSPVIQRSTFHVSPGLRQPY